MQAGGGNDNYNNYFFYLKLKKEIFLHRQQSEKQGTDGSSEPGFPKNITLVTNV